MTLSTETIQNEIQRLERLAAETRDHLEWLGGKPTSCFGKPAKRTRDAIAHSTAQLATYDAMIKAIRALH